MSMSNYDKIKELLEQEDYKSALLVAFSNSLQFKLVTKIEENNQTASIETQIDLLKGITTTVSNSELLTQDSRLSNFHQQQLENAEQMWQENRQMLITILQMLAGNQVDDIPTSNLTSSFATNSELDEDEMEQGDISPTDSSHNVDQIMSFMLDDDEDEQEQNSDEENSNVIVDEIDEIEDFEESDSSLDAEFASNNDVGVVEESVVGDIDLDLNVNELDEVEETILEVESEAIVPENENGDGEVAEDWNEFMDELSPEEQAVSEEIIVENIEESEEIDDEWDEWLTDENDDEHALEINEEEISSIDWNTEN